VNWYSGFILLKVREVEKKKVRKKYFGIEEKLLNE
jgi:hypothetical protein